MITDLPLATKRMSWGYQPFNMTSLWNPWTERSSGLNLSCGTEEPSTCGPPPMTSPGSSTTLWTWSGSCWPVWQLLHLSSQNVFCFVAASVLKQERRGKGNSCIWVPKQECPIGGILLAYFNRKELWKGSYLPVKKWLFTVQHLLSKFVFKEFFNCFRFRKMSCQDESWLKLYKSKWVNVEMCYFKSEVLLKNYWIYYNSVSHDVHRH